MSKIIEKVMLLRFNYHCRRNNLMPDYVSVCRTGYITKTVYGDYQMKYYKIWIGSVLLP